MEQPEFSFPKHYALLSPEEIYESATPAFFSFISEDRRIERKPAGIHSKSLAEYFSMWANTVPDGGIIVIGVEDSGVISGCHT